MIRNKDAIVANAATPWHERSRRVLLGLFEVGLRAVDPASAVARHFHIDANDIVVSGNGFEKRVPLKPDARIIVVGGGKATAAMATAIEAIAGPRVSGGAIVVPAGAARTFTSPRILAFTGGHPVPNEEGLAGTRAVIDACTGLGPDDVVVAVMSGGGSALMPQPAGKISLEDLQELNRVLLERGATIHEINAIRKHVSLFKGGWLARHAAPASIIALVLSDVVGDDLATIASGPTVPDPTTFAGAISFLKRRDAWARVPERVRVHLETGLDAPGMETPKPGDPAFQKVTSILIGSAATAAREIVRSARNLDVATACILTNHVEGEARTAGVALGTLARAIGTGRDRVEFPVDGTWFSGKVAAITRHPDAPAGGRTLLVLTGETTVTLRGKGTGGRNQEMLLSTLSSLEAPWTGGRFAMLACGMDGIEGNSPAAGAIIDDTSATRATVTGLDARVALANNDSHSFFTALGDAIITGPTGTNVNDVILLLFDGTMRDVAVITRDPGGPSQEAT